MPAQTSKTPGDGSGTLSYTLASDSFDIESVYASIDATTATGPVTAELVVRDQSGVVIARKKQAATIPAGATGSATWALRLDDDPAAGGYVTVQDEGVALPKETTLDFVGAGVTAADDPVNARTTVTIPGGGGGAGFALPGHRLGSAQDCWYCGALATANVLTTANTIQDQIVAFPFIPTRAMTLDRIAVIISGGIAASNVRLGVYTDDGNLYPAARLVDSGVVSTATAGIKSATISVPLTAGVLYWFVMVSSLAAVQVRSPNGSSAIAILGHDGTNSSLMAMGWFATFTFAALPDPFPASASIFTNTQGSPFGIFVRGT